MLVWIFYKILRTKMAGLGVKSIIRHGNKKPCQNELINERKDCSLVLIIIFPLFS